jgi:hypothetical protein
MTKRSVALLVINTVIVIASLFNAVTATSLISRLFSGAIVAGAVVMVAIALREHKPGN